MGLIPTLQQAWVVRTSAARHARAPFPLTVVTSRGTANRGAGAARNAAVRASSGQVLCIQDADDVMMPGRVAAQVAELMSASHAPVGGGGGGGDCGGGGGGGGGSDSSSGGGCSSSGSWSSDSPSFIDDSQSSSCGGAGAPLAAGLFTGHVIVGSRFVRLPADATQHYAAWANDLTPCVRSTPSQNTYENNACPNKTRRRWAASLVRAPALAARVELFFV